MPLFRYFAYVGGALLALLLMVNWYLPPLNTETAGDSVDRSTIRIQSQQKWPSAVVFDTTAPTIAPPASAVAAAEAPAAKPAREAFAMAVEPAAAAKPAEPAKAAKPHARRTRTARASGSHVAPPETFGFGNDWFAPRRETHVASGSRGFWPSNW